MFGTPLLPLDAGRIFGGLVGQSESNIRSVIQTAGYAIGGEPDVVRFREQIPLFRDLAAELALALKKKPGVVVLAIDENKHPAILRAVELGLASRLACDRHLAEKLAEHLGVPQDSFPEE